MEAMEGQPLALVERAEGSFGHLNKPSLKTLIRRLVEALPPENADAVLRTRRGEGREEAIGRFVKRVSECRNDVAHGRELKSTAEPDEGLLLLIARMKLLLIVHLLVKVGVPHEILIAKYRVAESWIWG
jgi:hypothetical protein